MEVLVDGPESATRRFIFAHGAGGAMDTAFMNVVAEGLAARGIQVVRFEFPYMAARRTGGRRGAPDRQPVLLETFREVIRDQGARGDVFVGGKSMGGRMASMVADEMQVAGLICFGYPFHPPGRPGQLRTAHLTDLRTRALILQGERDMFGTRAEVDGYSLSPSIKFHWVTDGDHSFKPRAMSGTTAAANLAVAIEAASTFICQE